MSIAERLAVCLRFAALQLMWHLAASAQEPHNPHHQPLRVLSCRKTQASRWPPFHRRSR